MFFGAEEAGLVGSTFYVNSLPATQLKNISVMLNYDMVGFSEPGLVRPRRRRLGHGLDWLDRVGRRRERLRRLLRLDRPLQRARRRSTAAPTTTRSSRPESRPADCSPGAEDEKTAAQALQWGGEVSEWFDPCYHQACDTCSNVDLTALDEMSDAVAHGVLTFAQTSSAVEGTDKGSDSSTTYDPDYKGQQGDPVVGRSNGAPRRAPSVPPSVVPA